MRVPHLPAPKLPRRHGIHEDVYDFTDACLRKNPLTRKNTLRLLEVCAVQSNSDKTLDLFSLTTYLCIETTNRWSSKRTTKYERKIALSCRNTLKATTFRRAEATAKTYVNIFLSSICMLISELYIKSMVLCMIPWIIRL